MKLSRLLLVPILFGSFLVPAWADDKQPTVSVEKSSAKEPLIKSPTNLQEFKDIQQRVQEVYKKVLPAVVGIQIGGASGSGVIVNEEGLVLTAGHVSGKPDTKCTVILPDGKQLKAKSLGQNISIDSGMIQIEEKGKWPFVDMGDSAGLKKGQWVVALGHPGGFMPGRTPVLRLGRVLESSSKFIQTDCTLVGGDSGGPLFDLDGKVVGIHSRIGGGINFNIHVPLETYRATWDRLIAGESWNGAGTIGSRPVRKSVVEQLGVEFELSGGVLKVRKVDTGSIADKAGLKVRDLLRTFGGKAISNQDEIDDIISKAKKAGDKAVVVEVDRGIDRLSLNLEIKK